MGIYVNDNGTLRTITRTFVNDNGTLRELTEWAADDANTLRHIFAKQVDLSAINGQSYTSTKIDPTDAFAGVRINSDGTIDIGNNATVQDSYGTDGGAWLITGLNSDYQVSVHKNSGTNPNSAASSALDTFLACSTSRQWGMFLSSPGGPLTANLTMTIRRASDSVTVATATFTISAEVTV